MPQQLHLVPLFCSAGQAEGNSPIMLRMFRQISATKTIEQVYFEFPHIASSWDFVRLITPKSLTNYQYVVLYIINTLRYLIGK